VEAKITGDRGTKQPKGRGEGKREGFSFRDGGPAASNEPGEEGQKASLGAG